MIGGAVASGCGGPSPKPATVPPAASGPPLAFRFDSLDEREVSSESLRGRAAVLLFLTTYGDPSLLQARFAKKVVTSHSPRVNAAAVFLERIENRPLVRLFRDAAGLPFPCAMADAGTVKGEGPIPNTGTVPMVVVLDPAGREVYRKVGVAHPEELTAALREAQRGVWGEREKDKEPAKEKGPAKAP